MKEITGNNVNRGTVWWPCPGFSFWWCLRNSIWCKAL